jgi:hypothetical protein
LAAIEEEQLQQQLAMMMLTAATPTLSASNLAKATNLNWLYLLSYLPLFFFSSFSFSK